MCYDLTNISQYAHVSNTAYRLVEKEPARTVYLCPTRNKTGSESHDNPSEDCWYPRTGKSICRSLLEELEHTDHQHQYSRQ